MLIVVLKDGVHSLEQIADLLVLKGIDDTGTHKNKQTKPNICSWGESTMDKMALFPEGYGLVFRTLTGPTNSSKNECRTRSAEQGVRQVWPKTKPEREKEKQSRSVMLNHPPQKKV